MSTEHAEWQPGAIECERHGSRPKAYVCDHLLLGIDQGFVTSTDQPDNPYPDAWCLACDRVRVAHGGVWNQQSEALITVRVVCADCYTEIRQRNVLGAGGMVAD
jgi:hypothetical protein